MPTKREMDLEREKTLQKVRESQERIEDLLKDLVDVIARMVKKEKTQIKRRKSGTNK